MFDFTNKTVLVTGGSRGIGAATVELFSGLGADVIFNYNRHSADAVKLAKKIQGNRGKCFYLQCNFSSSLSIDQFMNNVFAEFKKIDVLVNNAGIWELGGPVDKLRLENWRKTMAINLDAVFYFTKIIVRHMKQKNIKGRIINIASTSGQRGEAFYSHYSASKGAVISFTKSLAAELGPHGIFVNCVAPGWVRTDMTRNAFKRLEDKITEDMPIGRIPDPEDIAGPVVFLASEWAGAITGEILNVNAGSVMCG